MVSDSPVPIWRQDIKNHYDDTGGLVYIRDAQRNVVLRGDIKCNK